MGKQLNVEAWVAMFREIGLDDEKMKTWHRLFEMRYPEAHQSFLEWLGCSAQEVVDIRQRCRFSIEMKSKLDSYSISTLAHLFCLSRSTLLYYDRIGLLPPSGRTDKGYRLYSAADRDRLERICHFREAGLSLHDIHLLLVSAGEPSVEVLERRYREIGYEMQSLKAKRDLLDHMLKSLASDKLPPKVDKDMWMEMLRAAGMDDQAMERWHGEFEARAPEAHHDFLLSLDIPEKEVLAIRKWSKETLGEGQKNATQWKSEEKQRKTSR